MLLGPEGESCDETGEAAATIGGSPGYAVLKVAIEDLTPQLSIHNFAHEIGHNLGLYHARHLYSTSIPYNGTLPSNPCGDTYCYDEYGDLDVMGLAIPESYHFNAVFKEFLGWLPPQVITATGTYQIGPFESVAQALKLAPIEADQLFILEEIRATSCT